MVNTIECSLAAKYRHFTYSNRREDASMRFWLLSMWIKFLKGCSLFALLARKTARIWRFINHFRSPNDRKCGNLTEKQLQQAIWYLKRIV